MRQAQSELIAAFDGKFFVPKEDEKDELLWNWLDQGCVYTSGRRVEASNHSIHPGNSQPALTHEAAWILRHIMFSYGLHVDIVVQLWACYYSLIMRRPLPKEYFTCSTAIWSNIMAICPIDDVVKTDAFQRYITTPTLHGFTRYFFSSSDDSEHFKRNRHVCVALTVTADGQLSF